MKYRHLWALTLCALLFVRPSYAADACPFTGQTRVLQVQMFFGQKDQDGHPISGLAFAKFLETVVTPRFPNGFTVYDGQGQWLDPDTRMLTRESSKILQVHGPDSADIRKLVNEIALAYRKDFHQKTVGLVTNESCASFY
ncbi:MAG: DUF3574 domain-containing protein [Rhodospirillaceae bacterium]|nr:DUF3574 domain-containing protein [Rhodospirillaceae bacterium]